MPVPPFHGTSLLPTVARETAVPRECLWFYHDGNRAPRAGDWKIVANFQTPWELYDLVRDRSETRNLAAAHPDKVAALSQLWQARTDEFAALARQDPPAAPAGPALDPNAPRAIAAPVAPAAKPTIVAHKLKLKPGMAEEYRKRHDAIWPELAAAIRRAGISDYSIFFDEETNTLFAVQTLALNHTAAELRQTPILQKWWAYMAPLMEVNPDNSPVRTPLKLLFHQE